MVNTAEAGETSEFLSVNTGRELYSFMPITSATVPITKQKVVFGRGLLPKAKYLLQHLMSASAWTLLFKFTCLWLICIFLTFPTAGKSFLTWNKILLWFLAQHRKKILSSFTCRSSAVYSEIMPTLFSLLGSISRFPLLLISIFCMLSHWPNFRHRLLC